MTRILLVVVAGLVMLALACGGDDDDAPREAPPELVATLADVCTESPEVATEDIIQVDEPQPGDEVSSPIVITGSAVAFQDTVWVSVVKADGDRIIDYPGRTTELGVENTLTPYEVSVPFTVIEKTPACLWVYRRDVAEPTDAIRIPLVLVPTEVTQ